MKYFKAQGLLEYVVLFAVIVAAIIIGQTYIKRAYQGRLRYDADQLGQQYSPGHTTSDKKTITLLKTTTQVGNGTTTVETTAWGGGWTQRSLSLEKVDALSQEYWPEE